MPFFSCSDCSDKDEIIKKEKLKIKNIKKELLTLLKEIDELKKIDGNKLGEIIKKERIKLKDISKELKETKEELNEAHKKISNLEISKKKEVNKLKRKLDENEKTIEKKSSSIKKLKTTSKINDALSARHQDNTTTLQKQIVKSSIKNA